MTMKGTPFYMAPEIMQLVPYDHRADIYSFGMLLLQIATFNTGGLMSCWKVSRTKTFSIRAVINGRRPVIPPQVDEAMPGLSKLILKMTEVDPEKRLGSFEEVIKTLWGGEYKSSSPEGKLKRSNSTKRPQLHLSPIDESQEREHHVEDLRAKVSSLQGQVIELQRRLREHEGANRILARNERSRRRRSMY